MRPFDVGDVITFVPFANVAATALVSDLGTVITVRYSDGSTADFAEIAAWRPATGEEIRNWRGDVPPDLTPTGWPPETAEPELSRAQRRARRQAAALYRATRELYDGDAAGEDDRWSYDTPVPCEDARNVVAELLNLVDELPHVLEGVRRTISPRGENVPVASADVAHVIAEQLVEHVRRTCAELNEVLAGTTSGGTG